ncbi:PLC-like phosphodiesterase [Westerdykella ornata]|uniref:PLC-like phosphodiesterase n=1 Tax=Westerdykella ornata TaxID=318751 RepID=A0A6A6JGF3_WESOR|nr:PLC-like phosphodiesterase [Westerdykella ornata]KAF2274706.1 PLC-like phosphodiesterase [Westerdykella ornata]
MPSKGVKCYAYIAAPNVEIEFSVPKQSVTQRDQKRFTIDHLEVDAKNLGPFKLTGRFSFKVRRNGQDLTEQWIDINCLTGALGDGTMNNMDQTPSIFVEDLVITYGFYDAGPGQAGLPRQHQCYVTVTRNNQDWMRELAPPGSPQADKPFHRLVLPCPHDVGMNSMQTSLAIIQRAGTGTIKEIMGQSLPGALAVLNKVADTAVGHIAPDIVRALAITQKDTLDTMLKIGARYFEFRPAKCHRLMQRVSPLEDTLYFQHGAIPGMLYKEFLTGVVGFLKERRDEIVVVQNRWDGVPGDCPRGTDEEMRAVLDEVLRDSDLQVGNLDDMQRMSIQDLRNERKRLIITRDVNQVSNYDDAASATLNGDTIVAKLTEMSRDPPKGHPIVLLQCQATSTNIRDVIVASVMDSDVSTSPLLATKGICDAKILPLLSGETGKNLVREEGLVVLMNDFIDGGTVDVAISLCRDRLG